MLVLLILSFVGAAVLTSGHVWPFYSTPRKTVTLSSYGGHVFQEEGVWNYTTMLLREDMNVLILGARETIFALDLNNITQKKAMVKWKLPEGMKTDCSQKGKSLETECQNYIRILHKMPDGRMYVCGTHAFNPTCDYLSYKEGNLTLENKQLDGKGKCPFDPLQRYVSEFVDGELFSATVINFLGSEPVVMRSNEVIRSEFKNSWLSGPTFIGMKHVAEGEENSKGDDDKIYLFFTETAMEYDSYNKIVVSRVARVCKGDLGGRRTLQKKWTSFLKARLDCPGYQTEMPYFIQDVFLFCPGTWKTCVFYGVFTPPKEMVQQSAVCSYTIEDISKVFSEGKFKEHKQFSGPSFAKWIPYNGEVPDPRPGACINNEMREKGYITSLDLPDKTLQFVRDKPLMDDAVTPSSQQPLLMKQGTEFTRIVVASTTALDGSAHHVMFIGTASGSVLKAVNYNGNMVIIEEVQLFKNSEPVKILRLSTTTGQLYAGSEEAAAQMPLSACGNYISCLDCVLARDPYCGWDLPRNSCVAINTIRSDAHSEVVQSLEDGTAPRCPAVESTKSIKNFYAGHMVKLSCEPGSNLAQVKWHVNDQPVENSNVYHIQHNSMFILNATEKDSGLYTCTATESLNDKEYITKTHIYELRLGGFLGPPSIQSLAEDPQITVVALKTLVVILILLLVALVAWNVYKGHFSLLKCFTKTEETSGCQEQMQTVECKKNQHH